MSVLQPESSLIGIDPFDPSTHRSFAATVERLEHLRPGQEADIASYSIVITNHARPSIESLVIAWNAAGERTPRHLIVNGKLQLEPRHDVSIEANVDSAIFDDGTMSGPDHFGIVEFLRERQSAVKAIIARGDEGVASGKTLDDVLSDWPVTSGRHHEAEQLVQPVRRKKGFLAFLKQMRELSPNP